jgi:glycosyltransferase involved in cell wall biosynthesis
VKTLKRYNQLKPSGSAIQKRIIVSIPLTGLVRVEWMLARYGQITPVNWSLAEFVQFVDTFSPLSFAVDDARNIAVKFAMEQNAEYLFFIDHDVILPPDTFIKVNNFIGEGKYPVLCGLYAAKGHPAEPLLFRGRGNSWFRNWKKGDKVWVDGIPMGCTVIHMDLLRAMWKESEEYRVGTNVVRRVFHTSRSVVVDPETSQFSIQGGTEDLWWCDRVLKEGWMKRLGYKVPDPKNPFLMDTSIWCGHIDPDGRIYWADK